MCDILTAFATAVDPELADLCANITRNQIDEIGSMQAWLATATAESGDAASLACGSGHGGHGGSSSGNGDGDHGGGGHGGCDMMMGCGNMNCPSSMAFMTENMVMHTGMVSPSNLSLPFPPVVPLLTTVPPPHAPCSPTTGCCLHTAGRCRRSRCTASPRAVSCGVLLAPQASAV